MNGVDVYVFGQIVFYLNWKTEGKKKSPWFQVHHLSHVRQDTGKLPRHRSVPPPLCDPLFTVAKWQAATSCENSLCTCCRNQSQAKNSICALKLRGVGVGGGMEAKTCTMTYTTVQLHSLGWISITAICNFRELFICIGESPRALVLNK